MTFNFLVSIIIPSYNSEETLATTLDSVLSQTHTNWELILVDDHSSDQSISIAQTYAAKDGRIKVVPLTANLGTANARNIGIEKSTGAYIAFLDSDDTWVPAKLETQLQYIQKANLHFTYSAYYKVYKSGKPTHVVTVPRQTGYRSMMTDPFINTSTVLLSRQILTNAPFKNYHYEDLALWLQLLRQGVKMGGINEPLATYYIRHESKSRNKLRAPYRIWEVLRKGEQLSFLNASYYTALYIKNRLQTALKS